MKKINLIISAIFAFSLTSCSSNITNNDLSNISSKENKLTIGNSKLELENTFEEVKGFIISKDELKLSTTENSEFNTKAAITPDPFLIYTPTGSTTSYTLSLTFMSKLKSLILDGLLNKTDITNLASKATTSEKAFLTYISTNKALSEYIEIPNLIQDTNEPSLLKFAFNPTYAITADFLKAVYEKAINDSYNTVMFGVASTVNVLEKSEADALLASTTIADNKSYLNNFLTKDGAINKPLLNSSNQLVFVPKLATYYIDDMLVHGSTTNEKLSNISQLDRLSETTADTTRCGAGALIDTLIMLKGESSFPSLITTLGLTNSELTYKNIHLAQEALIKSVNAQTTGMTVDLVGNSITGGSAITAANKIGLKFGTSFISKDTKGSYQTNMGTFFDTNPKGVLYTSSNIDNTGKVSFSSSLANNHWVIISRRNGIYYVTHTGVGNGKGKSDYAISSTDLSTLYKSNKFLAPLTLVP
ncbi:MAG: hypothetical protein U0457_21100 [Candidatus Sericytochromatia bacterium]